MNQKQIYAALNVSNDEDLYGAMIDGGKAGRRDLEPVFRSCLTYPEASIRGAAIRVLGFYWGLPWARAVAEQLWREDPDEKTRSVALMVWADSYQDSKDRAVLRTLLQLLRDQNTVEFVRATAWPALLSVWGLPRSQWPKKMAVYGEVDALVDWTLVKAIEAAIADE